MPRRTAAGVDLNWSNHCLITGLSRWLCANDIAPWAPQVARMQWLGPQIVRIVGPLRAAIRPTSCSLTAPNNCRQHVVRTCTT